MKKILLTKNNYKEFISKDKKEICIHENMILTPGAKDGLRRDNIDIVYKGETKDDNKKDNSSNEKEVIANIINIFKKDFNITDQNKIEKVCNIVLNKINKK